MTEYLLSHDSTVATTGYFACMPSGLPQDPSSAFGVLLAMIESTPCDSFAHDLALRILPELPRHERERLMSNPYVAALAAEARLLDPAEIPPSASDCQKLWQQTGFTLLLWGKDVNRIPRRSAVTALRQSITEHIPMPGQHRPVPPDIAAIRRSISIPPPCPRISARDMAMTALEQLLDAGFIDGPEFRHVSSLAPVGLMRQWPLTISVRDGLLDYSLQGTMTSWGRGVSIDDARVSCVMEIVERASAYLSVAHGELPHLAARPRLIKASYASISARGNPAIHPDDLPSGIPYQGQNITWIAGQTPQNTPIWIPLQAVGLFCNLDEPSLMLPSVSTGLASGATPWEARRAALLEVFERDAEASTPFEESGCFTLRASTSPLRDLLKAYEDRHIHIRFRKLFSEYGVPCFEAFVIGENGALARATAAGLSVGRTLLSALTEVPWPFPSGPATQPAPADLPCVTWEELPDYGTGSAEGDVRLLEALLAERGITPAYADLTRSDLRLPVVRAVVPGLLVTADTDPWSPLPHHPATR